MAFNKLTEAEVERLVLLIEDCAEVQHIASKILRHGYESTDPTKNDSPTNRKLLEGELGDLEWSINFMKRVDDVFALQIIEHRARREFEVGKYLHHNITVGGVKDDGK